MDYPLSRVHDKKKARTLRAVDDPRILPASAFHGRLHETPFGLWQQTPGAWLPEPHRGPGTRRGPWFRPPGAARIYSDESTLLQVGCHQPASRASAFTKDRALAQALYISRPNCPVADAAVPGAGNPAFSSQAANSIYSCIFT